MIQLTPSNRKYKLIQDFVYKDVVVPTGFTTDGVSYKLRILALFIHRFDPRYIEAVVVHDYLIDLDEWGKANKYFEELLPKSTRSKFMIMGVKLYRRFIVRR